MAEGAGLTGGVSGASIGSKIGGLVGTVAPIPGGAAFGKVAGAAIGGLAGATGGLIKQKRAEDSQRIGMADPLEQSRMAELRQISKNISSGTDALTQNKISELQKMGAQTQGAIAKVSGGDVGATVQGMLQAQRNTQTGVNQALTDRGQLPYYQNMAQQLATRMSDRRLQLGLLDRAQQTAEYAQARKNANLNMMGALATGVQGIQGLLGNQGTPSLSSATKGGITTDTTSGLDKNVANVDPNQSVWANNGMSWETPSGITPASNPSLSSATTGGIVADTTAFANELPIGQTDQAYNTEGGVNGITPDPYAYAKQSSDNRTRLMNFIQPNFLNMAAVGNPGAQYMMQSNVPTIQDTLNQIEGK